GDGVKNGNESDLDCGGPSCGPCADGQACITPLDCVNHVCTGNVCQPGSCTDGIQNGNETDRDCGGGTCPQCQSGQACLVNSDCEVFNICNNNVCENNF